MRRTFDSTQITDRQGTVALEMAYFGTILKPLFDLSCPECQTAFHIDDTDFEVPWKDKKLEYMDGNWGEVAEGWADNWGLPPIGTIFRKGVGATKSDFKITARNFDIPSQPASNELNEITCLICDENYDIRDLEYRHIPMGPSPPEELEQAVEKYHELTVWGLNQKLS